MSFFSPQFTLQESPDTDEKRVRVSEFLPFPPILYSVWGSSLLFFRCKFMSYSLGPHGLQHCRLPCPSLSPRVCSDSCPLSQWCYLVISSSSIPSPFLFNLSQHLSLFPISQVFISGCQSIGASTLASVLPMNSQSWFPLRLTYLISLQSKGLARVFFSTTVWKHQFTGVQPSVRFNSHIHTWLLEKP